MVRERKHNKKYCDTYTGEISKVLLYELVKLGIPII
jgi:hypothetical protein